MLFIRVCMTAINVFNLIKNLYTTATSGGP